MKIVLFYHSVLSDWNHGNAHFLRGITTELIMRGHSVCVYEPADGWSLKNLLTTHGNAPISAFRDAYPLIESVRYDLKSFDLDAALENADLVIVHEWNSHELVARIGEHRRAKDNYVLLFHDTHHRSVTDPKSIGEYDLKNYDGVLAFGNVIRELYLHNKWSRRAWTWHEAADTRLFRPQRWSPKRGDLVWVGNWGDNERAEELAEFLLKPVKDLGLKASVYGVRYPAHARKLLSDAGIEYCGWLPNFDVPRIFAKYRLTVHIPRRPYVQALPGIPTIRPFEALACRMPLISAPWNDAEKLFTPGRDFLFAENGEEMKSCIKQLLQSPRRARKLAVHGRDTVLRRHTVAHRVDELLAIYAEVSARAESGKELAA